MERQLSKEMGRVETRVVPWQEAQVMTVCQAVYLHHSSPDLPWGRVVISPRRSATFRGVLQQERVVVRVKKRGKVLIRAAMPGPPGSCEEGFCRPTCISTTGIRSTREVFNYTAGVAPRRRTPVGTRL